MANYREHETVPPFVKAIWQDNKLQNEDAGLLWSSADLDAPPAIGTRIAVNFNKLGNGTICGYFEEDGWLGCLVTPDDPPAWWRKQNADLNPWVYHIFGREMKTLP
jgi:hypothetical protein